MIRRITSPESMLLSSEGGQVNDWTLLWSGLGGMVLIADTADILNLEGTYATGQIISFMLVLGIPLGILYSTLLGLLLRVIHRFDSYRINSPKKNSVWLAGISSWSLFPLSIHFFLTFLDLVLGDAQMFHPGQAPGISGWIGYTLKFAVICWMIGLLAAGLRYLTGMKVYISLLTSVVLTGITYTLIFMGLKFIFGIP